MPDSNSNPTVLVLDDEKNVRQSIEIALSQENFQVLQAHEPGSALRVLNERCVDVIILDIKLGEIDGLSFFKKLRSEGIEIPVIFISGHASLTEVAEAVKLSAYDFVEKPFSAEKIVITVKRCLEFSSLHRRLQLAEEQMGSIEIIGDSPAIKKVIDAALKVAKTDANVLITGESGTGKELLANAIRFGSHRANAPFIKVNCSAIPENLVESELFGHERGAFTGAINSKRGFFEMAHRGTIFLDEIADLSLAAQAKVLRVLQSGEIQKVGSEKIIKVDVRILSGTHKDLKNEITDGRFREDLFYRLNVVPLRIPSLRERIEDIPLLIHYFAKRLCAKNNLKEKFIEEDAIFEMKRYAWPGNVRELQNVMERLLIMGPSRIAISDLPEEILATSDSPTGDKVANHSLGLKEFRDQAEREFIVNTLKKQAGNISQTAIDLNVGRTYLHKRMGLLGISKKDYFV